MSTKLFINVESVPLSFWTFPGGERNVRIDFANKYSPSAEALVSDSSYESIRAVARSYV